MNFLISDALAETSAASADGGIMPIIFLVGMFVVMYFFVIRPQTKRQKEHKKLVEELCKGDEVQTVGGLMGKITELDDSTLKLEIAANTVVSIRRASVEVVLPKGSLAN
jgi:preprotein translocase subunit YajC